MAQSGYTPILIYASSTPGALPSAANLTSSASGAELAINYADGKLYFKNSSGVVTLLAGSSSGPAGGSNTQVQYNSSGVLAGSSNLTFDGTSLTLGGNPTLSAGTANGVLYLNGSKVATSGSALTFDGTNLGLQSATNAYAGSRNGATFRANSANGFELILQSTSATAGTSTGFATAVTGNDVYFVNRLDGFYSWITGASGNTEQMRLTSTGLGIGTSSPVAKFRVQGQNASVFTGGGGTALGANAVFVGDGTTSGMATYSRVAIVPNTTYGTSELYFTTRGLDSFGEYGAGIRNIWGGADARNNILAFFTSTAADQNVERMRLDSSGNLGIGTSSPNAKVDINGSITVTADSGTNNTWNGLTFRYIPVLNSGFLQSLAVSSGSVTGGKELSIDGSEVVFRTISGGSFTEGMRLTSTGLGIGTSSPSTRLHVKSSGGVGTSATFETDAPSSAINFVNTGSTTNAYLGSVGTALYFATNNTERARIDSSGNLLVGTTSGSGPRLVVEQSRSGIDYPIVFINNSNSSGAVCALQTSIQSNGNSTSSAHLNAVTQGVNNWYLYGNGTMSFSSDQRLKKNIETTRDGYLDDLMKLRVVKYNWHNQDDATPKELGLIAQEVEQVFPGLIQEHDLAGVGMRKNIKHSVMEFIMLKAIQEQQALIQQLTARVAALESN